MPNQIFAGTHTHFVAGTEGKGASAYDVQPNFGALDVVSVVLPFRDLVLEEVGIVETHLPTGLRATVGFEP